MKIKTFKCDGCGKAIITLVPEDPMLEDSIDHGMHLCPECMDEQSPFLRMEEQNENRIF